MFSSNCLYSIKTVHEIAVKNAQTIGSKMQEKIQNSSIENVKANSYIL